MLASPRPNTNTQPRTTENQYRPIHYISIDTQPNGKSRMYDTRTEQCNTIDFEGVRSFLQKYINAFKLEVVSIHESHLPQKTQLVCWYRM